MSGPEAFGVPEVSFDTDGTQLESGYVYTRADGTVEHARSAEEAFARCPVLGKLAIDQANILLELVAVGNAKMQQEEKLEIPEPDEDETLVQNEDKVKVQQEIVEASPKELSVSKPNPISNNASVAMRHDGKESQSPIPKDLTSLTVKETVSLVPREVSHTVEPQGTKIVNKSSIEKVPKVLNIVDEHQTEPIIAIVRPELRTVIVEKGVPVKPHTVQPRQDAKIKESVALKEKPSIDLAVSEKDLVINMLTPEITQDIIDEDVVPSSIELSDAANDIIVDHPSSVESNRDNPTEQLFDTETLETYELLVSLVGRDITEEQVSISPIENHASELKEQETIESPQDFQSFMASQLVDNDVVNIEIGRDHANQQPLEETFIKLFEYVSEVQDRELEQYAFFEIIQAIEKQLPACRTGNENGDKKEKFQITPEMTEKLLIFLRILGYQNPSEVLVELVEKYGLSFLLQALEYMCKVKNLNRDRLVSNATAASDSNNNSIRLRLSKVLFGHIAKIAINSVA